jgi:hypothetical protein
MPRNMSFAMTTEQVRNQSKTVTRRFGWWFLKPGDLIQPVEKAMGLKKGEQKKEIGGPVRIVSVRREILSSIDKPDCIKEGFPHFHPSDFISMLHRHYGCSFYAEVNRIEFEYI